MSRGHAHLGSRLRDLRQRKKLSSKDVADAIGITQSHLCAIERDDSPNMRFHVLRNLADYYGLSISTLIGESEETQTERAKQLSYWFDNRLSKRDQELLFTLGNEMLRETRE